MEAVEQKYDGPSGLAALQVMAYVAAVAVVGELFLWLAIYRKPEYRNMKANLDKATLKLEEAKAEGGGEKAVQKRERELKKWQDEASKQVAVNNFKTAVIMMVVMIGSYKFMWSLFGNVGAAVRLPFAPPSFIKTIAQRGLTNPEERDASVLFIYVLCQSTLRPLVQKFSGQGPTRAMAELKPATPKGWGLEKKDN